jgi:hypothetical protein
MHLHIFLISTNTDFEVMNMEPISFGTDDNFGVKVLPAIFLDNNGIDIEHGQLTQSELEAVARVRDQFHSKEDLRDFVRGLRER